MRAEGIECIAVIGTGMIGASLAALSTGNGYPTIMLANVNVDSGLARYDACFKDLITQGLVTPGQAAACKKLLTVTQRIEDLAAADFIFESVPEKLGLKHKIYAQIEKYCPHFKVIASTTSAIKVSDLAEGLVQKDRIVVAHPYNPPHLVPCVEVVKSPYTSDQTIATVKAVLESMGRKVALMNKDAAGFIANRIQHAMIREAVYMIEQGIAEPADIDTCLKYSIMPRYTAIGLLEHQDNAGLDLVDSIEKYLFPELSTAHTTQAFITDKVAAGDLGIKTGKGIYDWSKVDIPAFRLRAAQPYFAYFNWDLPKEETDD